MASPRDWLRYAEDDLAAAQEDVLYAQTVPRIACFNAQQAAEKLIKGVLLQLGIGFPKTHDLKALEALLPLGIQQRTAHLDLVDLSDWAVQARYPDLVAVAGPADSARALKTTEDLFAILRSEIK